MMKSVHFQVKKRLSFELQNVAVGLSSAAGLSKDPPLSAALARLAQRRIWQSISIKVAH